MPSVFQTDLCPLNISLSSDIAVLELKSDTLANLVIPPAFMPTGILFSPFRLSVRMFVSSIVRSYFRHVRGICVKVLRQSFSSGVYLSNYISESIHIRTIVTLEGWHSIHDHGPQCPCPRVGLEVKI